MTPDTMSKQAIDEGHERFLDAMRANDPAALMRELTDDVVFYPPNQEPPRGKAAVRAWYESTLADATTDDLGVSGRDVVVAGDWGIERGKAVWKLRPVGGDDPFTGRHTSLTDGTARFMAPGR